MHAEKRVALVIGNANYTHAGILGNPVNDARAMAGALKGLGFEVDSLEDAGKRAMEQAIGAFRKKLGKGAVGLLFYAGHGIQVNDHNYLIPVDAQLDSEEQVALDALGLGLVLNQMASAQTLVNLVILDACRDNPFERRFRGGARGLAMMHAPEGTLIAYATAPGKVADDGDPQARTLLHHLMGYDPSFQINSGQPPPSIDEIP